MDKENSKYTRIKPSDIPIDDNIRHDYTDEEVKKIVKEMSKPIRQSLRKMFNLPEEKNDYS